MCSDYRTGPPIQQAPHLAHQGMCKVDDQELPQLKSLVHQGAIQPILKFTLHFG